MKRPTPPWRLFLLFALAFFTLTFTACGGGETTEETPETEELEVTEDTPEESTSELPADANLSPGDNADIFGFYVGDFDAEEYDNSKSWTSYNRINISIDKVEGGILEGHSVVAGNDRPFSGPYEMNDGLYTVEAAEPGDDKYDGVFTFTIDPAKQTVTGTWESNDKSLAVTKRKYELERAEFAYNAENDMPNVGWTELYDTHGGLRSDEYPEEEYLTDDVTKFNASTTELKKEDIQNMYKGDLEVIRNSIYARHGYSFKNRRMRFVFDRYVDWYIPTNTDIRNELTEVEKKNIDLLKRYENHAENYYDYFGR